MQCLYVYLCVFECVCVGAWESVRKCVLCVILLDVILVISWRECEDVKYYDTLINI